MNKLIGVIHYLGGKDRSERIRRHSKLVCLVVGLVWLLSIGLVSGREARDVVAQAKVVDEVVAKDDVIGESVRDLEIVTMDIEYRYGVGAGLGEETVRSGTIEIALFSRQYPVTTKNFKQFCLGWKGRAYGKEMELSYTGVSFHRVVNEFVVQGGDILLGNGRGSVSNVGENGLPFADEVDKTGGPARKHNLEGMLAMANSGPDTNGSQFYFTLVPNANNPATLWFLDGKHTVFGRVVRGMNLIREISKEYNDATGRKDGVCATIGKCYATTRQATEDDIKQISVPDCDISERPYLMKPEEKEDPRDL
ncbi:hypothetical protein NEHOM01_2212 [Nematocida homosporus]|uniref:uncharacterized protein n=1 Tax=Nematocida homosporus TaxID=1912981 RepID=UPI0022205C29|nr:uncharacterized protein NEHOM01_2212 [Nematocida homosporus]KAI5187482.1 hypothetical protein NEHOM01_2212 [Nematocida homosporus]